MITHITKLHDPGNLNMYISFLKGISFPKGISLLEVKKKKKKKGNKSWGMYVH